jgi:lysine-specific demethylase/histidyl-hydroxylase NO66
MDFADLIAPLSDDAFLEAHFGKAPLHLPRQGGAPEPPIGWERMNALLAIRSHWTEANLKLVMDSKAIRPEFYIEEVETPAGPDRRADPAKVGLFLAMGASLVAHSVQEIAPEIEAVCASLSERFAARAEANVYCSFGGVQAFASHFDLHDVFVLQCAGEKLWNLYENRAASPVAPLEGDDAQATIDAAKGRVAARVLMRPGDRLYIPRGVYHDALATEGASLHITFSVAPLTARALFPLLADAAIAEEAFRAYLPDARLEGGAALRGRLSELGARLGELAASREVREAVARRQRELRGVPAAFDLPNRRTLHFYARTETPVTIEHVGVGAVARAATASFALGPAAEPAAWILSRAGFSREEIGVRYRAFEAAELDDLLAGLERLGAIRPYVPRRA